MDVYIVTWAYNGEEWIDSVFAKEADALEWIRKMAPRTKGSLSIVVEPVRDSL